MKLIPKNNQLLVKAIIKEDKELAGGLIIPGELHEDEQVAKGRVIESSSADYKKDDVILFHKVIPVDVHLKIDGRIEEFWFVSANDIICVIEDLEI